MIKKHDGVIVVADEIYELINFAGGNHSIASFPGMFERTVTVNGFSKGFAMTGWRVGYICAPLEIAKACEMDAGFGRGTRGQHVGTFIVKAMREREILTR